MLFDAKLPEIARIVNASFPDNHKPAVSVEVFTPRNLNCYWDGGSKDAYVFVRLSDHKSVDVPTSHPYYDRRPDGSSMGNVELSQLPEGMVLVHGGWFMGKPCELTIYTRPDGLTTQLTPPEPDLTDPEKSALNTVCITKGGPYRREEFDRAGLGTYGVKNPLIVSLISKGLLKANKTGAISATIAGRNVRG
jgi:hypothetical protein